MPKRANREHYFVDSRDENIWTAGYDQGYEDAQKEFDQILATAKAELLGDNDPYTT